MFVRRVCMGKLVNEWALINNKSMLTLNEYILFLDK